MPIYPVLFSALAETDLHAAPFISRERKGASENIYRLQDPPVLSHLHTLYWHRLFCLDCLCNVSRFRLDVPTSSVILQPYLNQLSIN